MVIFYLITIANLVVRLAVMVTLNFKTFFATTNLILSVASLMCALLTGTSHTKILMTLVIDLKTLKCINDWEYRETETLKKKMRTALIVWITVLVGASVYFFFERRYEYIMIGYATLFTLQTIFLMTINWILNSVLSKLFKGASFSNERRFLICTLIIFTISYFVVLLRTVSITVLL